MLLLLLFVVLQVAVTPSLQQCSSVDSGLDGTWTSTNLGTMEISSSAMSLSMTKTFTNTMSMSYFTCFLNSGTQYVFKMNETIVAADIITANIYGCFDFRQASSYAYYFYLNTEEDALLGGLRFKLKLVGSTVLLSDICEVTPDVAEFNTMIKTGSETEAIAAVQCPDPMLGEFIYTYTFQTTTYCSNVNTSSITACSNQNFAELKIDNTGCTATEPFYSSGGAVGCIASVYSSSLDTYYTSYYNKDTSPLSVTSYQFTCVAMQVSSGTVYLSLMPTDCISAQSPKSAPSKSNIIGATMVLTANCIPSDPTTTPIPPTAVKASQNWLWIIIILSCMGALLIFIIAIVYMYRRCKKMETMKAREKKILLTEEHPLGEMSIALDIPASMERIHEGYIDGNNELFKSPRAYRKKDMMNPMGETSMNLNFRERSWSRFSPRKSIGAMQMDPFSEMDSGVVLSISPQGSKAVKSTRMRSPSKQKTFLLNSSRTPRSMMNGDLREQLAITDGRTPNPAVETEEDTNFARDTMARSQSIYAPSVKGPVVSAPSIRAPSVRESGIKSHMVTARSIKAPSVRAQSIKAPSVTARSTKSNNSNKALSIRSNKGGKPKLIRSVTSTTRLGSVTRRAAPSSPRKKLMSRSKTTVMPSDANDGNAGGMADFMNAEMSNWGDASEAARSKRSLRTTRTTIARTSSKGSPRKSIQPRMTGIPNYFKAISVT